MNTEEVKRDVKKHLRLLMIKEPIFGFAVNVEVIISDMVPSLGITPNMELYINPDNWKKLDKGLKYSSLLHELLHVALGHTKVATNNIWNNLAMDVVVNDIIYNSDYPVNPDWAALPLSHDVVKIRYFSPDVNIDRRVKYVSKKNWLDVKKEICDEKEGKKSSSGIRKKLGHQFFGKPPSGKKANKNIKKKIKDMLGMFGGNGVGSHSQLCGYLHKMLVPSSVDWRKVLRRGVQQMIKGSWNWARPNTKRQHLGLYLASRNKKTGVKSVIVGIDVSCSTTNEEKIQFVSEVENIAKNVTGETTIAFFDTSILKVEKAPFRDNDIPMGGGTDFECMFDRFRTKNKNDMMIILTDGVCDYPNNRKNFGGKVLWCVTSTNRYVSGYGDKVIKLQIKGGN